jgi:osmotically-inducible protein OsmY
MDHDIEGHDAGREPEACPKNAELIGDDIEHALGHSWFFDPHTIHVSVSAGCVTLTGSVRSQRERRMAAAAAWAHEGVTDVENQLVLD